MKSKKKTISLVVLVLVFLCIAIGIIFVIFRNPKTVFINHLQKMSNLVFEQLEDSDELGKFLRKTEKTQITSKGSISFADSLGLEPIEFDVSLQSDQKEQKQLMDLNLKNQQENLLGLNLVLQNSKIYYRLKDIMDYYYFIDGNLSTKSSQIETKEFQYLFDMILKQFRKQLTDKMFEEEKSTLTISDKNIETRKITVVFKNQFLNNVCIETIEDIKKDDKALNILMKLFGVTSKEEVKTNLSDVLNNIKQDKDNNDLFTYEMYLSGNHVISQAVEIESEKITYTDYRDKITLSFSINDNSVFKVDIVEKKDDSYDISGYLMGLYQIKGNYSEDDDKEELSLQLLSGNTEIMNIKVFNKIIEIKDDKEYQNLLDIVIDIGGMKTTLHLDNKYQKILELDKIDLSNSVDYNTLSIEEKEQFQQKLMEIPLFEAFQNLISQQQNGSL